MLSVSVCFMYFRALSLGVYIIVFIFLINWPIHHYKISYLSIVKLHVLKSILSGINIATTNLIRLLFTWHIFFYSFPLNLFVSLNLTNEQNRNRFINQRTNKLLPLGKGVRGKEKKKVHLLLILHVFYPISQSLPF